jgi:hypothetical protein
VTSNFTVVVIGATGHFGGRICRRILTETDIELVVTSRSSESADGLAKTLTAIRPQAKVRAAALDLDAPNFAEILASLNPDIVIHTAGPYQGQDYRVAEACIDCASHYIDLADGRDFVTQFPALDERARDKDILLISGASTLPGLSSGVIDSLRDQFQQIDEIDISIAPAHQTSRGAGTVAAVLSYCGKPFSVLVEGQRTTMHGWQNMKSQRYADLGFRLSAACDVPDLALLPEYVEGVSTVTFRAALEAKWEHIALWLMGWLCRARIVRSWTAAIPFFQWTSDRLIRLGSQTGGMQITLSGKSPVNLPKLVTWQLTARNNHGPEIPCTPALILARKLISGELQIRGAYACLGLITLGDFDHETDDLDIEWSTVDNIAS